MRYIPLLLLYLIPLTSFSQTPRADSLKRVLGDAISDTNHVNMLGELAYIMRSSKPDSALFVMHQAYELAQEIRFDEKIDNILRVLGIIHFYGNNADSALWYFKKSEKLATELGDNTTLASVIMNQATLYKSQNNILQALEAYERALDIERKSGNKAGEGGALNNIGTVYLDQKEYDKAESYFLQGLKIQEEIGNKVNQIILLGNLGLVASTQNEQDKAIAYYNRSLAITREIQNQNYESLILSKIGLAYKRAGRFPQALDAYLQNLRLWENLESEPKIATALSSIGHLYEENNELDTAETYFSRSLNISEKLKDDSRRSIRMTDVGRIYVKRQNYREALTFLLPSIKLQEELGYGENRESAITLQSIGSCYENLNLLDSATSYLEKAQKIAEKIRAETPHANTLHSLGKVSQKRGNIPKAIAYVEEAMAIASNAGFKQIQSETSATLYELYKSQNNPAQALKYLEQHKALQDSIFNQANTKALAQVEANYKFEQEKQQFAFIQEQKLAEQRNTQNGILIALAVAVLVIFGFAWNYFQKQKANKLLVELNEEINSQKTKLEELDTAKSHFFTNISHEFRTPLTVILGMLDQVDEDPKKWINKGSNLIRRNSMQLLELVNQILDLRKLESGSLTLKIEQGDVVFYLRYLLESFHSLAETKSLKLHFLTDLDALIMDFDREKLLRVISNLLSNAIKYTHQGGDIYMMIDKISTSNNGESDGSNESLKLSIKDTGLGIPAEKLPYIFDRFYQVDQSSTRKGEGTGIGLALTKELVELMGGNIQLQS